MWGGRTFRAGPAKAGWLWHVFHTCRSCPQSLPWKVQVNVVLEDSFTGHLLYVVSQLQGVGFFSRIFSQKGQLTTHWNARHIKVSRDASQILQEFKGERDAQTLASSSANQTLSTKSLEAALPGASGSRLNPWQEPLFFWSRQGGGHRLTIPAQAGSRGCPEPWTGTERRHRCPQPVWKTRYRAAGFRIRQVWVQSWLFHFIAIWPWEQYATSLTLGFSICNMKMTILPSHGC
jgi:hypothetical protein